MRFGNAKHLSTDWSFKIRRVDESRWLFTLFSGDCAIEGGYADTPTQAITAAIALAVSLEEKENEPQ